MKPKILLVAHDPGGISSLAPLVPALAAFATTEVWLHPLSAALYSGPCRTFAALTPIEALSALKAARPDLIVTGTSMGPDSIDKRTLAAAAELAIPTIAFVDFWSNYRERFTHGDGGLILPALIATIDNSAAAEMTEAGLPPERIKIIGITRPIPRPEGPPKTTATTIILFISQALTESYGGNDACRARLGYTQHDACRLLAAAMPAFAAARGQKVELWLRHHPREKPWSPALPHRIVNNLAAEECLTESHIVTGMTGSLLIDALLLGRPTISLQPNLVGPDLFLPSRQGYVPRVGRQAELLPALKAALTEPPRLPPTLAKAADGRAVARFVQLIETQLI